MPKTSTPTSSGWSPRLKTNDRSTSPGFDSVWAFAAIERMPNTSTAVPMASPIRLDPVWRIAGPVANAASLRARVGRHSPVGQVHQPDQDGAGDRADHLRADVARHVDPGEAADRGQGDGHGGIEVRAAHAPDGVDGDRDRDPPAGGDDDPAGVVSLGPVRGRRWRPPRYRGGRASSCRWLPRGWTAWSGSIARRAMFRAPRTSRLAGIIRAPHAFGARRSPRTL